MRARGLHPTPRFLGLGPELLSIFRAAHGDVFEVEFWEDMQRRQHAGEIMDFFPYPSSRRLRPESDEGGR